MSRACFVTQRDDAHKSCWKSRQNTASHKEGALPAKNNGGAKIWLFS